MKHINKNGIDILIKNSKNTPRTAVCFYFQVNKQEKIAGANALFAKLLLQGTKTKTAEQLASELENNCIDVSIKSKQDYLKVSFLFLNEDFELAMQYAKDILLNSTFNDIEKEIHKIKGEITADLDNPRVLASDCFIKNLFTPHCYSNTCTKVLEEIDNIKKQDILEVFEQFMNSKKVISLVGDFCDEEKICDHIAQNFDFMKTCENASQIEDFTEFKCEDKKSKIIKLPKADLNQAQIFQGWVVPNFRDEMYPKIALMNNILGASGLSSRLFVELRDKQGLAYTVRSSYETLTHSAIFSFYIATEPKNIKKSLDGFAIELEKIANTPPSKEELIGGRENILGRLEYFSQTNSQIASAEGYNFFMGLGLNYNDKFAQMINNTTQEDVSEAAKFILDRKSLICTLAPQDFLNF